VHNIINQEVTKIMTIQLQEYIDKIHQAPLDKLKGASWLENHLLLELGLNDEKLDEFPKHLHPHCGFGLKSWQYPNQFSKYLVWLSEQNIGSYLEIGCRHGGTFIITVEYLQRFGTLDIAVAIDPFYSDIVHSYAKFKNNIIYLTIASQDLEMKNILNQNYFDLILVDGDHSAAGVRHDYHLVENRAKFIALHDIVNNVCPGVVHLWSNLKNSYGQTFEFVEQYESLLHSYLGIGIVDTTSKKYSSIQIEPVKIEPILEKHYRPFWSVMIPTYNCANYLEETLKSVLAQDPGPEQMQIEVVDDGSTKDDPEAVVKEIGQGRVTFFRQPENVGAPANFNTCVQRAKGHWVHILHGDDVVLPGFYNRLKEGINQEANLGAAFCRYIIMDENSHWQNLLSPIERKTPGILEGFLASMCLINRIMTPCIVVKRSVYEELGGFNLELFHSADWDMWKRVILNYPIWYEPQILACFRQHSTSDTSRLQRTGDNILEALRAIEISQTYLPPILVEYLSNKPQERHGLAALEKASKVLQTGNLEVAIAQIKAAIGCNQSPKFIKSIFEVLWLDLSTQLIETNSLPLTAFKSLLSEAQFLYKLRENISNYQTSPKNADLINELQEQRQRIAEKWLNLPYEELKDNYLGEQGIAHRLIIDSGFIIELTIDQNQVFVQTLSQKLLEVNDESKYYNYLLAGMLYFRAYQLDLTLQFSTIPQWLLQEYIKFIFASSKEDTEKCSLYQQKAIDELYRCLCVDETIDKNKMARNVLHTPSFMPPQQTSVTDPYVYIRYREILEKVLSLNWYKIEYEFGERTQRRRKIRLAILADNFTDKGSTRSTLPIYEYLSREFEVTLLCLANYNTALEKYCQSCASAFVVLPEDLWNKIDLIRNLDLDILIIEVDDGGRNNQVYLMSLFRMARVQIATGEVVAKMCSPNIDEHILLKESDNVASFLKEKLFKQEQKLLINRLKLRETNYLIFPDWSKDENLLYSELSQVLATLSNSTCVSQISLIIDTNKIDKNEVDALLTAISMNLIMDQGLESLEELQISYSANLSQSQWDLLLPCITGRIKLENEDRDTIVNASAENILECQLSEL